MKRISPGTVTVGVLAILFGLAVAYAARHYLERTPPLERPPVRKTARVVVPSVNLPKYFRIREQDVESAEIPIEDAPQGAVTLKSRALHRLMKRAVLAGQPLLDKDLYAVGEVPKLADQLPPGYRAVTLSVGTNSALNGMVQPESYVDVSLTVENDRPEVGGLATLTILRRVKVLATSAARFPRSEDRPTDMKNITVAVTPEQANKLILAERYGTLSVTLRGSADEDAKADDEQMLAMADDQRHLVNPFTLLGLSPIEPVAEARIEKKAYIWRAGSMQEVTFGATEIREALNATAVAEGGEPMAALPIGYDASKSSKKPCKNCDKKKAEKARKDAEAKVLGGQQQPTPAPAREQGEKDEPTAASLPGGGDVPTQAVPVTHQLRRGGYVTRVRVEANQVRPPSRKYK